MSLKSGSEIKLRVSTFSGDAMSFIPSCPLYPPLAAQIASRSSDAYPSIKTRISMLQLIDILPRLLDNETCPSHLPRRSPMVSGQSKWYYWDCCISSRLSERNFQNRWPPFNVRVKAFFCYINVLIPLFRAFFYLDSLTKEVVPRGENPRLCWKFR